MERTHGDLVALFIAHCGYCIDPRGFGKEPWQMDAISFAEARETLRSAGWHQTRKYGWVCRDCWAELHPKKENQ